MSKPQVSIVMGSDSDLEIMREAGNAQDLRRLLFSQFSATYVIRKSRDGARDD